MLIAIVGDKFPKVGTVQIIPPNPSLETQIEVHWMIQERATHKPKWLRNFKPATSKYAIGSAYIKDIILFGFDLTNKGCLKKKSREYLKNTIDGMLAS